MLTLLSNNSNFCKAMLVFIFNNGEIYYKIHQVLEFVIN